MVDWMIEVCTSFKCSKRTWFLAVLIFDKYLILNKNKVVFENSDVHLIGVVCMYLASKYEDIYPLHSKTVHEQIAHKAIPQKQILHMEGEFLKLFGF